MSGNAIQMYQYTRKATAATTSTSSSSTTTPTTNMFVQLMNNSTSDQFLYENACQQLAAYKRQSGKKITVKNTVRNKLIKK
jgi:hypothetical protein